MRKFVLLGLVLILGSGSFVTACNSKPTSSTTPSIATVIVKSSTSQDYTMSGKIEAVEAADVVSKMTGKVAQVQVDIGSEVTKGQILVSLEAADLEASVEAAQAALDTAQINFDMASQNLERAKILVSSGAMSLSDFQNNYQAPYLKAEAGLKSAEATLKRADIAYSDSFIRAPFDGIITVCNLNPGELASIQAPVLSMVNLDQVVIKGSVNETQINNLKLDQEVQVSVSAVPGESLVGSICNISPAAETSTKAYPVKVKIDNSDHLLKLGMFAEVRLPGNDISILSIPREAMVREGEKDFVFVVRDNVVEKRGVTAGKENNGQITIISGLSEGETIVTHGAQSLQNGQTI